jgi:hypothetical protein
MKQIYTDWHKTFPGSGQGKHYPYLLEQFSIHNYATALDYGCGKGGTIQWLESFTSTDIDGYDPGNEQYRNTQLRDSYDCVYSADVLEHIEREDLAEVISHMQSLSNVNIQIIDLTPAKKHLPDGRNAHVTLLNKHEWIDIFEAHEHDIQNILLYSEDDPNFTTRDRLCLLTRRT